VTELTDFFQVHKVIAGSLADRDGRIQKGDRVLSINGRSTKGVSHREALSILKVSSGPHMWTLKQPVKTRGREEALEGGMEQGISINTAPTGPHPFLRAFMASTHYNRHSSNVLQSSFCHLTRAPRPPAPKWCWCSPAPARSPPPTGATTT